MRPATSPAKQRRKSGTIGASPSQLHVHIEGHGLAGFLNVTAGQDYSDYAFRETMP